MCLICVTMCSPGGAVIELGVAILQIYRATIILTFSYNDVSIVAFAQEQLHLKIQSLVFKCMKHVIQTA